MNEDRDQNRNAARQEFEQSLEQLKFLSAAEEDEADEVPYGDADDPLWEDALADIERYLQEKGTD
jgi:hypothetical protein